MGCSKEQVSQHHASPKGHGCVGPGEVVLLAIFLSAKPEDGRVTAKAFKTSRLQDGDLSLSRLTHTDRQTFEREVISPKNSSDPFQGVAKCSIDILRRLYMRIPQPDPPHTIRAVCVLDKVEPGAHEGHAALEYCEEQVGIKRGATRGMVRANIAIALASAFGPVHTLDAIFRR